ncbi:MAG: autoinducer synthase [Hyphomicrobium sp.]|uniref:N-acyl amino acid synthase FeeM domain-containing protein n=1 Tax=Hyphomicrobium sp. TaxID=82 RepID=UPI0025B9011B|nr:autoinducer synthase [Hyphomicrobium sp.]MBX9861449.1 autoinducer synthase [Hyphomicrobium sp.]
MKTHALRDAAPVEAAQSDGVVTTQWYSTLDNRREAFALRHRGYVHAGLIEASPFGIYSDVYDELPTTVVAGLFRRGACVATLRLSFYTPGTQSAALPCEKVYPEVQGIKDNAQGLVVELSRLSIDPDITNTRYRARLYAAAIRAGVTACVAMDARHLLVATQTKWQSFYQHVMAFKALGPPQFYPPGDVPVVLLGRALDDDLKRRISKNMFFKIDDAELEELKTLLPSLIAPTQVAV